MGLQFLVAEAFAFRSRLSHRIEATTSSVRFYIAEHFVVGECSGQQRFGIACHHQL
jgi:hypothetical protein